MVSLFAPSRSASRIFLAAQFAVRIQWPPFAPGEAGRPFFQAARGFQAPYQGRSLSPLENTHHTSPFGPFWRLSSRSVHPYGYSDYKSFGGGRHADSEILRKTLPASQVKHAAEFPKWQNLFFRRCVAFRVRSAYFEACRGGLPAVCVRFFFLRLHSGFRRSRFSARTESRRAAG